MGKDDKNWKWKAIGVLVTVLVIAFGVVGSWYTNGAALAQAKVDIVKSIDKNEKQEQEITSLKIQDATQSVILIKIEESQQRIEKRQDEINIKLEKLLLRLK